MGSADDSSRAGGDRREELLEPSVDATRRTHLASERTYLAWLRSGLTSLAVAIGVGKVVPDLVSGPAWPFALLGVGFAILGIVFCALGIRRQLSVERSLREGRFVPLGATAVVALGLFIIALAAVTTVVVVAGAT
jgi:putative membrane protein